MSGAWIRAPSFTVSKTVTTEMSCLAWLKVSWSIYLLHKFLYHALRYTIMAMLFTNGINASFFTPRNLWLCTYLIRAFVCFGVIGTHKYECLLKISLVRFQTQVTQTNWWCVAENFFEDLVMCWLDDKSSAEPSGEHSFELRSLVLFWNIAPQSVSKVQCLHYLSIRTPEKSKNWQPGTLSIFDCVDGKQIRAVRTCTESEHTR